DISVCRQASDFQMNLLYLPYSYFLPCYVYYVRHYYIAFLFLLNINSGFELLLIVSSVITHFSKPSISGTTYIISSIDCSTIARKPLAPVLLAIALCAIALSASSVNSSSTPS